jgi:hypothetical protein
MKERKKEKINHRVMPLGCWQGRPQAQAQGWAKLVAGPWSTSLAAAAPGGTRMVCRQGVPRCAFAEAAQHRVPSPLSSLPPLFPTNSIAALLWFLHTLPFSRTALHQTAPAVPT